MRRFLQWLGLARSRRTDAEDRDTGRSGERAAEKFLRREKKHRILARNWRSGRDELDLVSRDGEVLVFVEVKTRQADALVPGYYTVDDRKKKALKRACYAYLKQLRKKPRTFRFDVVEIGIAAGAEPVVYHFENIPLFPKGFQG